MSAGPESPTNDAARAPTRGEATVGDPHERRAETRVPSPSPLSPSDLVTRVPGVGRAKAEAFARLGVATIDDLLRLAPRRFEDRRRVQSVAEIAAAALRAADATAGPAGLEATWIGTLASTRLIRARGGLAIVEAIGEDDTGRVVARWWNQPWLYRSLRAGTRVMLHGAATLVAPRPSRSSRSSRSLSGAGPSRTRGATGAEPARVEFSSPAVERVEEGTGPQPGVFRLVPVHPLTKGLSAAFVRRAVWNAMPAADRLVDPLPASMRAEGHVGTWSPALPSLAAAARDLHFPDDEASAARARARFAFDELLVFELMLARRRAKRQRQRAAPFRFTPTLEQRIRARIPFALTPAQAKAVAELRADLERPVPMSRLLQGDVGSGKTLVAVYACLACVANGSQAAFLAPTEILARQHEATIRRLLVGSDVRVEALYGARRGKGRTLALARVAAGEADLVIGTHAVLSRDVAFKDLALVVVDEQHKFGVEQRRQLLVRGALTAADAASATHAPSGRTTRGSESTGIACPPADRASLSGRTPHLLVMTATPIPRSLAMVVYGDLDLTVLDGMPPGRGVRTTWVAAPSEMARVVERVREEVERGRQAFIVYPLVEAPHSIDSASSGRAGANGQRAVVRDATAGREAWALALPGRGVGLVHGQMPSEERAQAMEAFRCRAFDVLVATVVVEVGVDVPNATVLVVEHAERFGLSQLHQLRGRVGRGRDAGLCVLVDRSEGGTPDRLKVLERTEDGFEIAEADLRLRGGGDLFGTRQHGAPEFASARLPDDLPILLRARETARRVLTRDPALSSADLARLRERVRARESASGDPTAGG